MGKPLSMQAREAIGKQYGRQHASQTTQAVMSAVKTFTEFVENRYGLEKIENMKTHMVESYVAARMEDGIGTAQLTRDATAMRLLAEAIDKANIVPRTNAELGINRDMSERYSPQLANGDKLSEIRQALAERAERTGENADKALVAAYDLRTEFGVRANESLMSRVIENDGRLALDVLGAKGGRERVLEPQTEAQIRALEQYRDTSREIGNMNGKCIPPDMSSRQMYDYQRNQIRELGGTKSNGANMHAMRHEYAQGRISSGADRLAVAEELGHGREEVVHHYVKG
ncbi:MAG: integrase domain-containing protein [Deltaproteobacteria bacterium]